MPSRFDVIVIGAGHAGCEAAYAAAQAGRARRPLHAVDRHRRAHALQSRDRRHGEGTSRPRDRRARRADGRGHRRHRHPVQVAEPEPRSSRVVAAGPGGQAAVRRVGEGRARARAEHRVDHRSRRTRDRRARSRDRAGDGRRRHRLVRRAGRDDRHVSQRAHPHRAGAASGRARRRAAVARSGRFPEVVRLRVGPAEDGHAAAARSREHRVRSPRGGWDVPGGARRRSAGGVFVSHPEVFASADRLPPDSHQRARP